MRKEVKKDMNYKSLGIALVVMLAMVGAVSAAENVHLASQDKGIASSFSFTMTGQGTNVAPVSFPLSIGDNLKDVGSISVVSNVPWTLSAKDAMPQTGVEPKPVGSEGKMTAINAGGYWDGSLTNPLQVKWNGGSYVSLTGTNQVIHSGTYGSVSNPLAVKQTVLPTDLVLPTGSTYYLNILVTGAATA